MDWYLKVLKNYVDFGGRARRTEFWYFTLINTIILVVLVAIDTSSGRIATASGLGAFSGLYAVATFLPNLGVTVRRLHDTTRSGWWVLLSLIPLIGELVLIIFLVKDSSPGTNQYGANPNESAV